jgi:antitoxin VapB
MIILGKTKDPATSTRKAAGHRPRRQRRRPRLADQLLEIGSRCASLPDLDTRTADDIVGYDENGLPR